MQTKAIAPMAELILGAGVQEGLNKPANLTATILQNIPHPPFYT